MKTLFLIGGPMGAGKTAVCQSLKNIRNNSVFLDGDWCWDANPFLITEETKAMVMDNICHCLNNFLHCGAYETVIFCWVMHRQEIIDQILERLDTKGWEVKTVSLICTEAVLKERLERDVSAGLRLPDVVERSLARLPLYERLHTVKIDTSSLSIQETAQNISRLSTHGKV